MFLERRLLMFNNLHKAITSFAIFKYNIEKVLMCLLCTVFVGPSDIKCGFDAHLCSFTQDTSDETDWMRENGKTPKPLTGPTNDHTTGTGK